MGQGLSLGKKSATPFAWVCQTGFELRHSFVNVGSEDRVGLSSANRRFDSNQNFAGQFGDLVLLSGYAMLCVNLGAEGTARARGRSHGETCESVGSFLVRWMQTNLLVEEVMRRILSLRHWWRWFASLLLAAAVLLPAAKLEAQAPQAEEFSQNVKQVYFPLNVYTKVIDPAVLDRDAEWLKQHPDAQFWIQGYADIRGDIVYNLVLSYRRAQWIKQSLVKRGVNESQIGFATGWGKLYPVCGQNDSQCFQKNRYVEMVLPGLLKLM
jgi:OmpA family